MLKKKDLNVILSREDIIKISKRRVGSLTDEQVNEVIDLLEERLEKVIDFELADLIVKVKTKEVLYARK